jgi:organic radical activating enzyme
MESPKNIDYEVSYPVMEHFYTIQGEGFWAGTAAYFVRLAGCDVGCHWCDVKESWDAEVHPQLTLAFLIAEIKATQATRVVVTGGEPSMHDLTALCSALKNEGFLVHIETSGTQPFTGQFDWICLSPKKFKPTEKSWFAIADELKVVIFHPKDFEWAETLAQACKPFCHLFLQPEWERKESNQWIIDYVKDHPRWRISLQTHKFLNIP